MKSRTFLFALALVSAGAAVHASGAPAMTSHGMAMAATGKTDAAAVAAPKLQAALRSLWHGHVVHTRDYALAVHAHHPAQAKLAADAVVANARQIADAVGSFYGKAAGERMMQLLAGHWGGVKALTDARAANDSAAQDKAMTALNGNVTEIAQFLAGANPNLPEPALQGLLATHVAHHATQIRQIMSGDTQGEQATWDAMQHHMDVIADALAGAIAKQFPAKAS